MTRVHEGSLLTRLRPRRGEDAETLQSWDADPCSEYEDWDGSGPAAERVPPGAGGGELVVTDAADQPIGTVSWRPVHYGPTAGSQALDIGISLRPAFRGQGHGARAQRMLASYLFTTTAVHRIQASTDVRNVAEQRALLRAGFAREGVLRGAQWRRGGFHDLVSFAVLRDDA